MGLLPSSTEKPRPTRGDPVNIASPEFKADPYPFYARLRAEAPVCRVTLPTREIAWLVTRYDDVAMVLRDERFVKNAENAMTPEQFAAQPWFRRAFRSLKRNMLNLDPPDHPRLRALAHKAFTPRRIDQIRERIQGLTNGLLDDVRDRGRMDLIRDYALPLPTTIIAEMLGVPAEDRHKFHRWSNAIVTAAASPWNMMTAVPKTWMLMRYIRKTIKERRANPGDDLLSDLIRAEEAGATLSEDELSAMVFLLLVAGHETTVNLIGSGVLALLEHPDQMARLRNDPALMKPAVEELLRYTSPVDMATERYAARTWRSLASPSREARWSWRCSRPRTGTRGSSRARTRSTSRASRTSTCPSGSAPTSAWVPRWPGSRARSPSARCSAASRICGSRSRSMLFGGGAGCSYAASNRCRWPSASSRPRSHCTGWPGETVPPGRGSFSVFSPSSESAARAAERAWRRENPAILRRTPLCVGRAEARPRSCRGLSTRPRQRPRRSNPD